MRRVEALLLATCMHRAGSLCLYAALVILALQVLMPTQGRQTPAIQARLRRHPTPAARGTPLGSAHSLVDWRRLARSQPQQQSIPRQIFITVPDKARVSRLAQARCPSMCQQPLTNPAQAQVPARPSACVAGCDQDLLASQPRLCCCCGGRCGRPGDHPAGRAQPAADVCAANACRACRPLASPLCFPAGTGVCSQSAGVHGS